MTIAAMKIIFEREHCANNPHITRKNSTDGSYVLPSVQDAWAGFQTGYQAAIAEQEKAELVEADKLLLRQVFSVCEATEDECHGSDNDFKRGRAFEAKRIRNGIGNWYQDAFCGRKFMGEPVYTYRAPVKQEQYEPVAWLDRKGSFVSVEAHKKYGTGETKLYTHPAPVEQEKCEPVAYICVLPTADAGPTKFFTSASDPRGFPIFTHPAPVPTGLEQECRSSVKFDLNRYERMILDYKRLGPEGADKLAVCEAEANRLQALLDRIDAALAPVPDGWQLVPVEPTPEMIQASWDLASVGMFPDGTKHYISIAYKAMLAAAPKPGDMK